MALSTTFAVAAVLLWLSNGAVGNVILSANISLTGDICPESGVNFTCIIKDGYFIMWSLNNKVLATFNKDKKVITDLCKDTANNQSLKKFCEGGGRLIVERDKFGGNEITSYLITSGIEVSSYLNITCGDHVNNRTLPVNFTLACFPSYVNVTIDDSLVNSTTCKGPVKVTCTGKNVGYFYLTGNGVSLSGNFTLANKTGNFPISLQAHVPGMNYSVEFMDTNNTSSGRFNFIASGYAELTTLKHYNMSQVGCASSAGHTPQETDIAPCAGIGDVNLSANISLTGDICPESVVMLTCIIRDEDIIMWSLNNKVLTTFTIDKDKKDETDLCKDTANNQNLKRFCEGGNSLIVDKEEYDGNVEITSYLVTSGAEVSSYSNIACGDGFFNRTLPVNVTLACFSSYVNVTIDDSFVDSTTCEGLVKVTCTGENVEYFEFTENGMSLSENFTLTNRIEDFPIPLQVYLPGVNCSVDYMDTSNTSSDSFNFIASCDAELTMLKSNNVSQVGCTSSAGPAPQETDVICPNHLILKANVSLTGNICPAGVLFNCSIHENDQIWWYLNDMLLVTLSLDPDIIKIEGCEGDNLSDIMRDFCDNGGSVAVERIEVNGFSKTISYLMTTGTYISTYSRVTCRNSTVNQTYPIDFNLTCGHNNVNIAYNDSMVDDNSCKGPVEVTCYGTDVKYFWFTENEYNLTTIFSQFENQSCPIDLPTSLPGVKCRVDQLDTNNTFAWHFNFRASCKTEMEYARTYGVFSISCDSDDDKDRIDITCAASNSSHFCSSNGTLFGILDYWLICHVLPPAAGLFILSVVLIICCCCCCWKCVIKQRKKKILRCIFICCDMFLPEKDNKQVNARKMERECQAESEKAKAMSFSKKCFKPLTFDEQLQDIGSRLQKYWYLRKNKSLIQFTAKISTKLPFQLNDKNFEALRTILKSLKHTRLLRIKYMDYEKDYVSVVMEKVNSGSVRDFIYKAIPTIDWEKKYTLDKPLQPFTVEKIRRCGSHVLQAVNYLYDLKIPAIGQIHCGNVFCKDDGYYLGGYENVFLGYKTSSYSDISKEGLLNHIDLIMFGHMLYEMSTGRPANKVLLESAHFRAISNDELRKLLQDIFSKNLRRKKCPMKALLDHKFFKKIPYETSPTMELSGEAKELNEVIVANLTGKKGTKRPIKDGEESIIILSVFEKLPYSQPEDYSTLGWRVTKALGKVQSNSTGQFGLLTIISVPSSCPIFVKQSMKQLQNLLQLQNPHLLGINKIYYEKIDSKNVFVTFQDIVEEGSLKHHIHGVKEWNKKFKGDGKAMSEDEIASIGAQLLEAIMYLIHLDGKSEPLTLGCIHTGNIFKKGGTWRLAGFENTLLGLEFWQYDMFKKHEHNLDVLMFGHVIYEMATGKELKKVIPTEEDYKKVPTQPILSLLTFIFKEEPGFDEIRALYFFASRAFTDPGITTAVGYEEKLLLLKVRKGKPRNQNNLIAKTKSSFKQKFKSLPGAPSNFSNTIHNII